MTRRVGLIGCGGNKRATSQPIEARGLYTSTYFARKREFAETHCDRWRILSAKHGAISAETEIQTYERHIDDVDGDSWARTVGLHLWKCRGADVELVVLAGRKYVEPIRGVLDDLERSGVTVREPFAGSSGLPEQQRILSELIEDPEYEHAESSEAEQESEPDEGEEFEQATLITDGGAQTALFDSDGETRVGHCKHDSTDVYAGRGPDGRHMSTTPIGKRGWLGNPFPVDEHGRVQCVERFRSEFEARLRNDEEFRAAVRRLSGVTLGCWCQRLNDEGPLCHAEVIAEWADRLADGDGELNRSVDTGTSQSGGDESDV